MTNGARNETNFLKSIAFLFVCSNPFTTTSKYLGINLNQHMWNKDVTNYPIEKQARIMNHQLTGEEKQPINIKTCSTLLAIRGVETEMILISSEKMILNI